MTTDTFAWKALTELEFCRDACQEIASTASEPVTSALIAACQTSLDHCETYLTSSLAEPNPIQNPVPKQLYRELHNAKHYFMQYRNADPESDFRTTIVTGLLAFQTTIEHLLSSFQFLPASIPGCIIDTIDQARAPHVRINYFPLHGTRLFALPTRFSSDLLALLESLANRATLTQPVRLQITTQFQPQAPPGAGTTLTTIIRVYTMPMAGNLPVSTSLQDSTVLRGALQRLSAAGASVGYTDLESHLELFIALTADEQSYHA